MLSPMPLALTPYMGWNTYYGVGGIFDEQTIISVAQALVDRGLARAGYRIVWLDYGSASGARDAYGELIIDADQWPHGLRGLTDQLHSMGLLASIYTDAGPSGCDRQGVGSLGHYKQDAERFAAWGFDAVKIDFCGGGQHHLDPRPAYHEFTQAIKNNSSGRPMIINVCNFWRPGQVGENYPPLQRSTYATHQWASQIAHSWRTDTDVGFVRDVVFENVLRNLDTNTRHPHAAGPGHRNDPDYIVPELGMSHAEAQTQLTMWAIAAAPLVIGSDIRALSSQTIEILSNTEVIAVDQDPLGIQGTPVKREGTTEVWAKPLADSGSAVALLNRGPTEQRIVADANEILPTVSDLELHDLWTKTSVSDTSVIAADVPPHSAALYQVTPSLPVGSKNQHC
jgi:alpha-galactosidase